MTTAATETSTAFLVGDLARTMRREFQRELERVTDEPRLTFAQAKALMHIAKTPGLRQVDLAERLEVQPITLARLLDLLASSGLVERRADPEDRRAHRLFLCDGAEECMKLVEMAASRIRERLVKDMSDEQVVLLQQALKKMTTNLIETAE
ncbi:MarR family winged helix-turn-helix transcriptional regulator [Pokkaliibacter sp. CJK22405]|uniref:MarR family winged helix-turn-helix transcriptional regulator n=1 Tax=Pokkaliibacter sp. CJK22405 TaxID=3384615 RepID=UPI0039848C35